MTGFKHIQFWILFLFSNFLIAQDINFELGYNLSLFYSEVGKENAAKSLELSKKIDSIIAIEGDLDIKSSAIYNNAKGYIYNLNNLDPEPYLIKADSLNELLPDPDLNVKIFSSFLLGGYYFNNKEDEKSKKVYSKLIGIEDLPEKFYWQKLKALQNTFFIERSEIYENNADSISAKGTAEKIAGLSKLLNDTLTISYGKSLVFLGQENDAKNVFHSINNILETDSNYNRYNKFLALNWLDQYYYKAINYNIEDTLNAEKLRAVSEELLSVIDGTDYMEPHNVYAVYGDLVIAGIITKNKEVISIYEKRIIDLLNQENYPKGVNIDLKRLYYTFHKLKMYYEFDKNYEKAKFYALKNVELTKYLYGEISIEHEQELRSYELIIRLKQFDYDSAFKISIIRSEIIKSLFGEKSIEYMDILNQQYGIKLNQLDYRECLAISSRALKIMANLDCANRELCNKIKLNYLQALNQNKYYEKTLEETDILQFKDDIKIKLEISSIKRNAYFELEDFISLNYEYETILSDVLSNISLSKDNLDNRYYFLRFLNDYQEYLRSTGRFNKAISFSENNMYLLKGIENNLVRSDFLLAYLNVLVQNRDCVKALDFVENNEILNFKDIDSPEIIALWNYKLNFILGSIYGCLNDNIKAIKEYKKAELYDKIDNSIVYSELARLNKLEGNFSESDKYFKKFTISISSRDSLTINELYLVVDDFIKDGQNEKAIEYLLPLSEKIIDQICQKSFFSSNDNNLDKINHSEIIKIILLLNNIGYYDPLLFKRALIVSNLYKRRLEYYADINIGMQRLKAAGYKEAIDLQNLESRFNKNPSKLLEEEIAQIKTNLISSNLINVDWLCNIDFSEIYNSINKNELVVNMLSYHDQVSKEDYFNITYNTKGLSLVTPGTYLHDLYNLFEEENINSRFFEYIKDEIIESDRVNGNLIETFYIIPSGKSSLINFSAYSLSFEEKLGRKIKVHIINSLTDIPKLKSEKHKKVDNLILIGDIDFDKISKTTSKREFTLTRGLQLANDIENSGIPNWGYLPGTKKEIESIERVALKNNIPTLVLSGSDVTEKNLQQIIIDTSKNNIVHVATHAYFFPDDIDGNYDNFYAKNKNPFLRSGLILSGANENWNNKTLVDPNNDGILTAEEISFMDLSGVELIVLSACDTGLGDVSNLEGINGLQRAFKLAGANKLIMSLWKVPDKETAEFFNYFYIFLLDEKLDVNQSFRKTQKTMKEKYKPFYWASFILLE